MMKKVGLLAGSILLLAAGFIGGALIGMEFAYASQRDLPEVNQDDLRDAVAAIGPRGVRGDLASARMTALGFSCRREKDHRKLEYVGCGRVVQRHILFSTVWVANFELDSSGSVAASASNFAHTGL